MFSQAYDYNWRLQIIYEYTLKQIMHRYMYHKDLLHIGNFQNKNPVLGIPFI